MDIQMIGVPIDAGQKRRGVDLGPNALRYAQLCEQLSRLGHTIQDLGNIAIPLLDQISGSDPRLNYLDPIVSVSEQLAQVVKQVYEQEAFPLILGGDHSVALGSISGVASVSPQIGVIWIDAHGDFHTHETSFSGNIHGMTLAALAGLGNPRLTHLLGWGPKLRSQQIVLLGVRHLDAPEKELLREHAIHVFTMADIDEQGISAVVNQAMAIAGQNETPFHVSLDVDVIDPQDAPGVGTPVRGGLSYREAHVMMEMFAASSRLRSLDVVEVNPLLDRENSTAELVVELIASALGKMVLPRTSSVLPTEAK